MSETPSSTGPGFLLELEEVLRGRRTASPDGSYTARLLAGGVDAIGAKVREEAGELVDAAGGDGDVVHEAADLLYHALVLLVHAGVPLGDVLDELERRRR